MARAKQTDRADARRRYRQAQATAEVEPNGDSAEGRAAATTSTGSATKRAKTGSATSAERPSARAGLTAAFRGAYHPAHLREDLAALPTVLRSWGAIIGLGLVVIGAAAYAAYPNYTGGVTALELLVVPGTSYIPQLAAGFFAPRASYLLGFLVAILQVLLSIIVTGATALFQASAVDLLIFVAQALVMGALFAAAAAWYRRFLNLSSPKRAAAANRSKATANRSKATR